MGETIWEVGDGGSKSQSRKREQYKCDDGVGGQGKGKQVGRYAVKRRS